MTAPDAPRALAIRAVEPRDAADVHAIQLCPRVMRHTLSTPALSLREVQESLERRDPQRFNLVAVCDGRVVGHAGLRVHSLPRLRHAATFFIEVHDDYQGRGLGRALARAVLDLADNHLGLRRVELHVHENNARAIALYETLGFVLEGRLRGLVLCEGEYIDALVMGRVRA